MEKTVAVKKRKPMGVGSHGILVVWGAEVCLGSKVSKWKNNSKPN
jgi:hypothetical protein